MQDVPCEEIIEVAEGPSVCASADQLGRHHHAAAIQEETAYGTKIWLDRPLDDVLAETRRSLSHLNCRVIWEVDIQEAFRQGLKAAFPRYIVLGVAKVEWISEALDIDRDAGLLMPFNLVVYEQSGGTVLEVEDPMSKFAIVGGSELQRLARHVKQTLLDVVDHVAAGSA